MNFGQFTHTDYHYCGKEQVGEDERREICGLQISWQTPPFETKAIASFRFILGERYCEMHFDKEVVSHEPMVCDGLIEEVDSKFEIKVCRSTNDDLIHLELNTKRLGAPTATISFNWKSGSKDHIHHLGRVQGIAEFQKRLAAYSLGWIEWYEKPQLASDANNSNTPPNTSTSPNPGSTATSVVDPHHYPSRRIE